MTDQRVTVQMVESVHIQSHAHANQALADAPYLAYCLVQACKLLTALICKRWPAIR